MKINDENRSEIISKYCEKIIDDMDYESMYEWIYDVMFERKDQLDNETLQKQIENFYPEILDEK